MFTCCWPRDKKDLQLKQKQLEQPLIEAETKTNRNEQMKQPEQAQIKKEIPLNINLQKMSEPIQLVPTIVNSSIKAIEIVEQVPLLQSKSTGKSTSKIGSFQQLQKMKKKSDLWDEQSGTKILYVVNQKEEEMIFIFKIINVKTIEGNPLNYALNPLKHSHKIRTKPTQVSLNFIIWSKSVSQTKSGMKFFENDNYLKNIFGVYKQQDDQKGPKMVYQTEEIAEIIIMGNNCIRLQIFDKIIISCLNEKDFKHIIQFCQKNTEFFQLDDLSKIIFIFPPELSLSEINLILSKLLRKHLLSQKLQNVLKHMGFHVQLVQSEMFEPVIIVKNNIMMCQKEEIYSKQFQIKLQLAIGLLMIQINYNNFKVYEKVLDSFFIDMTIIKYLKLIQFIHKEKKDYLNKLEELKIFQNNHLVEIHNSNKIQEKVINPFEKCIVIKHRTKKRMGELFADYRSTQTPIEQSQKRKKEWDDDLRENDIRVTQLDKNIEQQLQENCNIFQAIDDSFVQNANLDIIASLEFKESD